MAVPHPGILPGSVPGGGSAWLPPHHHLRQAPGPRHGGGATAGAGAGGQSGGQHLGALAASVAAAEAQLRQLSGNAAAMTAAPPPPHGDWLQLERVLADRLEEAAATNDDILAAQMCLKELTRAATRLGPGWRVKLFGSITNGFAKHGSDLDATCFREHGADPAGTEPSPHELLELFVAVLSENPNFEVVQEIKSARIPIVKLKFMQELDVDLSFQNVEPLPNTQMLRSYVSLDPRIRELGVLVKLWASEAGVCGATKGHLSAYAITLMVIYFLQVDPSTALPVLPTSLFGGESGVPPRVRDFAWRCDLSRAALLRKFFNFFAKEFQWGSEVVSVRTGRRAEASNEIYGELRGRYTSRIHIEDPFLLGRNLHCALRPELECELYAKLWEAAETVQQDFPPVGLRPVGWQPYHSWGAEAPSQMLSTPILKDGYGVAGYGVDGTKASLHHRPPQATNGGPLAIGGAGVAHAANGRPQKHSSVDVVGARPEAGKRVAPASRPNAAPEATQVPRTSLMERWRF